MNTRHKILIVDDDRDFRENLSGILKEAGYTPVTAATGKEAMKRAGEDEFAVALIDLRLEDMSGLDVLKGIKNCSPMTEGILVTGYASRASAIDAVNLLAYSYVEKPFDVGHLLATIRMAIEKRKVGKALQETLEMLRRNLNGVIRCVEHIIEMKDPYTVGHQRRVTDLARTIAQDMGLTKSQRDAIRMAGIIHDIGKISVPAEILSKPTPLTETELSLLKVHARIGYDILKEIEWPYAIPEIVLQHHERMDGSGYPQGLSGQDILLEARILGVADVVESMNSSRPYRPALGIDTALEEIFKNRGILYDADVVDVCMKVFTEKGFEWR